MPARPPGAQEIPQLDDQTFYQFLQNNGDKLCVVDYYSDWCGPCQMMNKELDKLVAAFPKRVMFAKMNVGNHPEFGTRQRIRALPTFRLYYKGACVDELTGARPVHLRQMLTHYSLMASIS
ncbi:hypothetical protein HYH02_003586 [Chlamydomonas schloesseri]|uniref:Thioredoxin n=1 Tax=Chlamydomonas schloesseri TaxID=2026947 RepID=A0A835WQG7_9CHLO|nr:hypothetical protein HYH02_003586 [Chlamydomonas schloesseri]|eukprot:KAG2451810.1 hypothetical protein HYH02_003586 [Chlamydomonas schloesseri]